MLTNLCSTNKDSFSTSISTILTHNINLQSSHLTDLVLLCIGQDGLLPVSVHSAFFSCQSGFLRYLLLSTMEPVFVLPEVEETTVRCMLDLLYTGRCLVAKKQDRFKLSQLLLSLGLGRVDNNMEVESVSSSQNLHSGEKDENFAGENIVHKECKRNIFNKLKNDDDSYKDNVDEPDQKTSVQSSLHADDVSQSHFCQVCGMKFSYICKLKEHYTSEHFYNEVSALVIDDKCCQICGKIFNVGNFTRDKMIRHVGATHGKVLTIAETVCGPTTLLCDYCQICNEKMDVTYLGKHLAEKHFQEEIRDLSAGQSVCNICYGKVKCKDGLTLHIACTHGQAMKMYRDWLEMKEEINVGKLADGLVNQNSLAESFKPIKISKVCHICGSVIAGSGRGWRFPMYSHFARIHFSQELVRDFRTDDGECSICEKEVKPLGKFLLHVGAKHKMVERYLDMTMAIKEYSNDGSSTPRVTVRKKETKLRSLKMKVEGLCSNLKDETGAAEVNSTLKKTGKGKMMKNRPEAKISCPYCVKKVRVPSTLRSHLLTRHFKDDCEEAIRQILERSGGVCPLCPGTRFSQVLDWKVFIHFSRKHKIAENLQFSDNLPNEENVNLIVCRIYQQN